MTSQRIEFGRVVFGEGAFDRLRVELDNLDLRRAFIVTTRGRSRELAFARDLLRDSFAGVFDRAVEHAPVGITAEAEVQLRQSGADVIVAIGGGSPIGLGKALVRRTGLPLAAVPTTYSGSEMTTVYGETDSTGKTTGRDERVGPRVVLYDPLLTMDLPAETSASSGLNALAHGVEALYAPNTNEFTHKSAQESIRLLARSLREVVANPSDVDARTSALKGAQLAGQALNATSMGLHHRICHVLGGQFRLPHSRTHAVILRYVVAYNFEAAPDAMRSLEDAMRVKNAIQGISDLGDSLPVPRSLSAIGLQKSDLGASAAEIVSGSYPNPRTTTETDVLKILRAALVGADPFPLSK